MLSIDDINNLPIENKKLRAIIEKQNLILQECGISAHGEMKRVAQKFKEYREAYTKLNKLYEENCNFTGRLENALQEIKELCKETTANVNIYGYERDYTYKAIVEHNNKILKIIRKGLK